MKQRISLIALLLLLALPASAHRRYIVYSGSPTTTSQSTGTMPIDGLAWRSPVYPYPWMAHCYLITSTAVDTTGVVIGVNGPAGSSDYTIAKLTWWDTSLPNQSPSNDPQADQEQSVNASTSNLSFTVSATGSSGVNKTITEFKLATSGTPNAGPVNLFLRSEVPGSSVTVHEGSWCEYSYQEGVQP